jgi:hypothetical protein
MNVYRIFITFYVPVKYSLFISEVQVPKLELHFAFDVSRSFFVLHGSTTASCALREACVIENKILTKISGIKGDK